MTIADGPRARSEHNSAACRASKHQRVPFLITADETSLLDLELLLVTLPLCATGRVFIEIPDESWRTSLSAPPRMTVTWLDRSSRSGEPGTGRGCAAGQAISRAVAAYAGEMLCDHDGSTRVHLLGGYLGTADIFDHVTACGIDPNQIHVPERFGLTSSRGR